LAPRLEKLFDQPSAWWQGQMKKYFVKLLPELDELVKATVRKMNFKNPIAGIHVRRTDKVGAEAWKIDVEIYMKHVEMYFDRISLFHKVEKRRVFVASDDLDVAKVVREQYPEYEVITNLDATVEAQEKSNRYTFDGIIGIVTDLYLLSKCDYVVCTFSSNVGRYVYEVMSTFRHDSFHRVRSLDARHHNFAEKNNYYVAVMKHVPSHPSEVTLEKGDPFIVMPLFNAMGMLYGTNERTNQSGYIPAFKVEDVVDTVEFPTYSDVL
jgi:glycoprotein 6-alpha-L-fucosyltransferase